MVDAAPQVEGDPFARPGAPERPELRQCRLCHTAIDTTDAFCRVCGGADPGGVAARPRASLKSPDPGPVARARTATVSSFRAQCAVLALAALLLAVGCRMPWISAGGFGFSMGVTPPMGEVWPVLAGAAILGLIGGAGATQAARLSVVSWITAMVVAVAVTAYMFPRFRDISEVVGAAAGFGVSFGPGIWMIGAGALSALVAAAGGLNSSLQGTR